MASSSAHVKNTHDKNAHAKNDHDKNAHVKNAGHTSKDAHAKNVGHDKIGHDKNTHVKNDDHDKNTHVKNVIHGTSTHAKNDHDKNAHAKNDHEKNTHGKNVGHDTSKNVHDKNAHAKDDHDKNTHGKNVGQDTSKDVHDKNSHAKNDHEKPKDAIPSKIGHDKNAIHGRRTHAKINDHDNQIAHSKTGNDKNAHAYKENKFLARCPAKGEHEFMVRDGETTEHFWCDVCRLDGTGRRYKCKHCNYRLHESCYKARQEMKCPLRPRDGHKFLTRDAPTPFWCDGCREIGVGIRFKCDSCHYRLHEKCYHLQEKCKTSTRPPTTTNANFPGKVFHFLLQHPGNYPGEVCSPCGRDVCGFIFKATDAHGKSIFLHPHCSDVEKEWNQLGMRFHLLDKTKAKCMCCKKGKAPGWAYVSDDEKYCLHIVCVIDLIVRGWKEGQLEEARLKSLENVDLAHLAEQLEKKTGLPWKKFGMPLLKFVAAMVLSNAAAIGALLIALL